MNIYSTEIPLRYNAIPYDEENPSLTRNSVYLLDHPIKLPYAVCIVEDNTYENNLESTERHYATIFTEGNDFKVKLDYLPADDEDEAVSKTRTFLRDICLKLTFLAQLHQSNPQTFHSSFYWEDREIKLHLGKHVDEIVKQVSKGGMTTLQTADHIRFHEAVGITIAYELDAEDFAKLGKVKESNPFFRFMLQAYYGALRDPDIPSTYFRLFTIIEYLEQNFISKQPWEKLIPENIAKNSLETFITDIKKQLNEENESADDRAIRLKLRINQILTGATLKNRAEKLFYYLTEIYGIHTFSTGANSYLLTLEMLKDLIKQRNNIFHGRDQKEKDQEAQHLKDRTTFLLLLCQEIMKKEIEKYNQNVSHVDARTAGHSI